MSQTNTVKMETHRMEQIVSDLKNAMLLMEKGDKDTAETHIMMALVSCETELDFAISIPSPQLNVC